MNESIAPLEPPDTASSAGARPRRVWFPWVWPATLAIICLALWASGVEAGVVNSVVYGAVGIGILGEAIWIIRSSGLSRAWRWTLGLAPVLVFAALLLQLMPFELILDGDLAIVGARWRWRQPDRQLSSAPATSGATIEWRETPYDYPRFLGDNYWAEVPDPQLMTDWKTNPPLQLWKQEIGAGWSAFAIVGDYAVTQEQRGDYELVVCYEARTGDIVWTHRDLVRWDPDSRGSLGGVGPRATPTIHDGKVFTHGATGIVNCIDAASGQMLWRHDTLAETGAEPVMWGKANSPLIVDDRVVISVGSERDASLVAYDIATGEEQWRAGRRRSSYASPVLTELGGLRQILSVNEGFVTAHRADDGQVLWEFEWPGDSDADATASQPVPVGDDRVFLSKGYGQGAELIQVKQDGGGKWSAERIWKNRSVMRTKMCNVVVRDGFVYGLNEGILQCIDLNSGKSRWKKRRDPEFGHGQIMLVGPYILLVSESGELVLLDASPERYQELASFPVLEGVTWNNPALSGNMLLVRNAEQAAAFELPVRNLAAASVR